MLVNPLVTEIVNFISPPHRIEHRMKERFATIDVVAEVEYLNRRLLGMRLANVYDIDHKTYLLKLARSEEKAILLFESGCRMHITEFEWPKGMMPSGFSMKLRKHLRTKRLVSLTQLGVDRVVDLQFGSGEVAHHLIIELYDRGNVILTDHSYTILSILRTRTDADTEARFASRETFSMETVKREQPVPTAERTREILAVAKAGDQLKHVLNPHFVYGSALLTHCLLGAGFPDNARLGNGVDAEKDLDKVMAALVEADGLFKSLTSQPSKGILIQKREKIPSAIATGSPGAEQTSDIFTNVEFHPMLFRQHQTADYKTLDSFDRAVDEFFSAKSGQKQDLKAIQLQKTAVKKLENIKQDHTRRIDTLMKAQEEDVYKATLIELNSDLIERACLVIRSAVANSMDWSDIELLVKDAQTRGDPVAQSIHGLKLYSNHITMMLKEPEFSDEDEEEEEEEIASKKSKKKTKGKKGVKVDIDLELSAYANARKYYDHKKQAAKKQQKTIDASAKALKSAEKKTKQVLKEAATVSKIHKARKVHWFEKFYWFISSENYLVIGGRDQQQNELVVKKYLNDGDLYVHADLHGATSVIIKNPSGEPVPPKTLNEAALMAVCYSSAWEAKIVTSAWWVYHNQVSKTAPTGEYLTTGSFMIRGKKNYMPPCQLTMGFAVMFKLDDLCVSRHKNERRVKSSEDDQSIISEATSELSLEEEEEIEVEEENGEGNPEDAQPSEAMAAGVEEVEETALQEVEEESEEEDDTELAYPDTVIQLHHVGGDRFELQRSVSNASSTTLDTRDDTAQQHKGDKGHKHMSAKQRRMMKQQSRGEGAASIPDEVHHENKKKKGSQKPPAQPPPQQYKRGQKSKQKRVRDKYGDQDEEERQLKMEILASAGGSKADDRTKGKKGKRGESTNPKHKYHQKNKNRGGEGGGIVEQHHKQEPPKFLSASRAVEDKESEEREEIPESLTEEQPKSEEMLEKESEGSEEVVEKERDDDNLDNVEEGTNEGPSLPGQDVQIIAVPSMNEATTNIEKVQVDGDIESDDEEKKALVAEENLLQLEEAKKDSSSLLLDSLTGSPFSDDVLLFAVPVCAPYSALLNYKYKVKLIPGTNRRGKAAKTAVHRFIQTKETSQLERDLLKSIKDNDLSRYFPGKVKMTIPQVYKFRHK